MSLGFSASICLTFSKFPCPAITNSRISSVEGGCCSVCTRDCCLLESITFAWILDQDGLVGPVGFEPTTSGPDVFSESPAPQGHRPLLDSGILWAGLNPLDQARRRPPLFRVNSQVFYLSVAKRIQALIAG